MTSETRRRRELPRHGVRGRRLRQGRGPRKEHASEVTGAAGTAARDVMREATDQVAAVKDTVATQAHDLLSSAQSEVKGQAQQQTERAGQRQPAPALAQQAAALSEGRPQEAGPIAGWVDQGRQHLEGWSSRLEAGGLDGLMSDVGSFARRRPLVFLGAVPHRGWIRYRSIRQGGCLGRGVRRWDRRRQLLGPATVGPHVRPRRPPPCLRPSRCRRARRPTGLAPRPRDRA